MDIEYGISGNDDFEYAQGLCSQAEEYYGLDLDYYDQEEDMSLIADMDD